VRTGDAAQSRNSVDRVDQHRVDERESLRHGIAGHFPEATEGFGGFGTVARRHLPEVIR
jgi:hypothetical protein